MAANSLSASDNGRVSITIPQQYVERFREETLFTLGSAAQRIQEIVEWRGEKKLNRETGELHQVTADDLQNFRDAELVFVEAHAETEGDLSIEGSRESVTSAVVGCTLDAADSIKKETEKVDGDLGPAVAEFEFWRSLREQLEGKRS
jgi:hypothetical protein